MIAPSPTVANHHAAADHQRPVLARTAGVVLALTVALAVLTLAFALPAVKSKPHAVPIGIAGPTTVTEALQRAAPGAFAVTYYPGVAALRQAVLDRQVYGGLAVDTGGPTLLIATGGSPAVAQLLTQVGASFAQHSATPLTTEDLAPPKAGDPRGAGLAASALPITLASILPAIALVFVVGQRVWIRAAAAGLAIGAGLAVLIGNPLSGLTSAPEMLPAGWGTLGQLLPQGATATLLRSTAHFGGAGAESAILVLSCWAAVGTVLMATAALRRT